MRITILIPVFIGGIVSALLTALNFTGKDHQVPPCPAYGHSTFRQATNQVDGEQEPPGAWNLGNPDSYGLYGSFSPAARGTGRLNQSGVDTVKGKRIKWDAFFIVAGFREKTDVILNPGSFFKGK